jgi:hypothetical protein
VVVSANAAGVATWGVPIPAGLLPIDFASQTFELVPGGPILGFLAGSNGLRVRAAGTGCP